MLLHASSPSNRDMNCVMATHMDLVNTQHSEIKISENARMNIIFSLKIIKIALCAVILTFVLGFSDAYKILIKCPDDNNIEVHTQIEFPFSMYELTHERTVCNNSMEQIYFKNNFSVESGVFVGLAAVSIIYVFCMSLVQWKKQGKTIYLIVDGVYTGVLSALWLNSSFMWAVGLEHFMEELELDNIRQINRHICKEHGSEMCHLHKAIDFLPLDVSVLIGFVIALMGVLIVSLICIQVFYPSKEDNGNGFSQISSHGHPIPHNKRDELDEAKLLDESDSTSTSSRGSGSQCC